MREINRSELAALKPRVTEVWDEHCGFTDYPVVILRTDDGWIAESLKPALFRPHMWFGDQAELDRWLAELLGYADSKPDEDLAPFLALLESPHFPENLPPVVQATFPDLSHPLDFTEASVAELSDAFRDDLPDPEDAGTVAVTLYVGEAIRRAIGGRWSHEVFKFGHFLYLYHANGEDTHFLELAQEQTAPEEPEDSNLFQIYEDVVNDSQMEWPQAAYNPPEHPVPLPEEAVKIDDAELARLKERAFGVVKKPIRSPFYPFVVYQLNGELAIESLRPSPERPHLFTESPWSLDPWMRDTEGFTPAPRVAGTSATEFWEFERAVMNADYPANLPQAIRKECDLPTVTLDFSVRSLDDLSEHLERRWTDRPQAAVSAILMYTFEILRRTLGGQWELGLTPDETRELHIRTADGRLCDLMSYVPNLIYDDRRLPDSLYAELLARYR